MEINRKNLVIGIAVLGVIAAAIAGWAYTLEYEHAPLTPGPKKIPEIKSKFEDQKFDSRVTGQLAITAVPSDLENRMPVAFTYLLGTHEWLRTAFSMFDSTSVTPYHMSYSSDGKFMTFIGDDENTEGKGGYRVAVYRSMASATFDGLHLDKLVTASDHVYAPRMPQVSDRGQVVYSALPEKATTTEGVPSWVIHLADDNGDRIIARGASPHWVNDKKVAFLAQDGVRLLDIGDDTVKTIIPWSELATSSSLTANTMMTISKDGTKIAISQPDQISISVFTLTDRGAVPIGRIFGIGFWPVFSPDSKLLALQTVRDLATVGDPKADAVVKFYDVSKPDISVLAGPVDLAGYNANLLFLSDWK